MRRPVNGKRRRRANDPYFIPFHGRNCTNNITNAKGFIVEYGSEFKPMKRGSLVARRRFRRLLENQVGDEKT